MMDAILLLSVALLILAYFAVWALSSPTYSQIRVFTSPKVSRALLLLHLLGNALTIETREAAGLVSEGLSRQNLVQLVITILLVAWACVLLLKEGALWRTAFRGPRVWLTSFALLCALSVAWSIWPALTIYRSVELLAFIAVGYHALLTRDSVAWFRWYLAAAAATYALSSVLTQPGFDVFAVASLRSNVGTFVVGALILLCFFDSRPFPARLAILLPLSGLFLAMGSLATFVAIVCALAIGVARHLGNTRSHVVSMIAVLIAGMLLVPITTGDGGGAPPASAIVDSVGQAFGKTDQHIATLTGRVPLWQSTLEHLKREPLGYGFGADRVLFLGETQRIGWTATHAHSGYVAAAVMAGVVGFCLLLVACLSPLRRRGLRRSPSGLSLWTFLVLNNLTILAVGGFAAPGWLLLILLAGYGEYSADGHNDSGRTTLDATPRPFVVMPS
jgi:hypothetical protein